MLMGRDATFVCVGVDAVLVVCIMFVHNKSWSFIGPALPKYKAA